MVVLNGKQRKKVFRTYAVIVENPEKLGDNAEENLKRYGEKVFGILDLMQTSDAVYTLGSKLCGMTTDNPQKYIKKLKKFGIDAKFVGMDIGDNEHWSSVLREQTRIMRPLYEIIDEPTQGELYVVIVVKPEKKADNIQENLKRYGEDVSKILRETRLPSDRVLALRDFGFIYEFTERKFPEKSITGIATIDPKRHEKTLMEHGFDAKLVKVDVSQDWREEFGEKIGEQMRIILDW